MNNIDNKANNKSFSKISSITNKNTNNNNISNNNIETSNFTNPNVHNLSNKDSPYSNLNNAFNSNRNSNNVNSDNNIKYSDNNSNLSLFKTPNKKIEDNNNLEGGFITGSALLKKRKEEKLNGNNNNNISPIYKSNNTNNLLSKEVNNMDDDDLFESVDTEELLNIIEHNITLFETISPEKSKKVDSIMKDNKFMQLDNSLINSNYNLNNTNNIEISNKLSQTQTSNKSSNLPLKSPNSSKLRIMKSQQKNQNQSDNINNNNTCTRDLNSDLFNTEQIDKNYITPHKNIEGNNKAVSGDIRSDIIVKKLLELQANSQLESLLGKYNLKLCFDNQEDNKINNIKKAESNDDSNRLVCNLCYENSNK